MLQTCPVKDEQVTGKDTCRTTQFFPSRVSRDAKDREKLEVTISVRGKS